MRTTHFHTVIGIAVYVLQSGCALETGQRGLPAEEQQLLAECRTSLTAKACADAPDEAARNLCFEEGATAYAERPTQKLRRRWLLANGCPAEVINGGNFGVAAATSVPKEPAVVSAKTDAVQVATVQADPVAATLSKAPSEAEQEQPKIEGNFSPSEANEGVVQASLVNENQNTASTITTTNVPVPSELPPAPHLNRGARAKAQLRQAIVAHQPEMKRCVDRQLKLVPTLKAEGTLVVDVDARGKVPRVELKGKDLTGTALELCLRTAAARWRFPRTGQSYSIEAPLVVTGTQDPS